MGRLKKFGVVDLFCGIGGLSYGMKLEGFNIIAGYDTDATCKYAYEFNNETRFLSKDVREVSGKEIRNHWGKSPIKILAGCAPCQPFSSYSFKNKEKDPNKYDLLYEFGRLVQESSPDIITMENVPQIKSFTLKPVLQDFVTLLQEQGYQVSVNVVFCPDYGIPQTRKRLVLLASRFGEIKMIGRTNTPANYVTVRQVIGNLPKIEAGEICRTDGLHRSRNLSQKNRLRIKSTPYGGSWKDWPQDLLLECYKKETGKSFGSVYGRMKWDEPSPTITTECTGLGNGRFGHPDQDRAISAREAALLQTFPSNYHFFEDEESVSMSKISRYIGNAVPPRLGQVIAKSIKQHLKLLK